MSEAISEAAFEVGDRVMLDKSIKEESHIHIPGRQAWQTDAVVVKPVAGSSRRGHGNDENTTHAVGIQFDGYDYGPTANDLSDPNCHTVANNKISLIVTNDEIEDAIASIKEAARGH